MQIHTIPPVFDKNSEILILGSFPSVKSREVQFFYGHPQNRFWRVLSEVYSENIPVTTEEKKLFLLRNRIALWDVIGSCEIVGSSDSSVKNAVSNDIGTILDTAHIKRIFLNGKCAEKYYKKYLAERIEIPFETLPSTSPANAAYSVERLVEAWRKIKEYV